MDSSKVMELLTAAGRGDIARLQELVPAAGEPSAVVAPDGITPLMLAAAGGHAAAVELLLERGADPSRRDDADRSAAAHARAAGHADLAARLDGVVDQDKTLR